MTEGQKWTTLRLAECRFAHLDSERKGVEENQFGTQLSTVVILQESVRQDVECRQYNQHAAG